MDDLLKEDLKTLRHIKKAWLAKDIKEAVMLTEKLNNEEAKQRIYYGLSAIVDATIYLDSLLEPIVCAVP